MSLPDCVILGGGGHARVVLDALRASGAGNPVAVVDAAKDRWGQELDGVPIVGGDDQLPHLFGRSIRYFVMGIGGAGNNAPRARVFQSAVDAGFKPVSFVHPRAYVAGNVTMGEGVQVMAHATINPGATIGSNVIVNTGAVVEHDCVLADNVHIASGACLAGGVIVEDGAHVGARSVIRQLIRIGQASIVGAGAAVVNDVEPGVTVAGVPATVLKPC